MKTITLLGNPRTTNTLYRSACRGNVPIVYMSTAGQELKQSYGWQAKSQWKAMMLTEEVKIDIKLYFGTKRKYDIDNFGKILLDSLTGIVWQDDSLIQEMKVSKFYDKDNPRIEITIL